MQNETLPAVERVVGALTDLILGELTPGAQLPSEAALAATYDVSRLTVREAVRGVDVVLHCAAKVGDWGPVEDYRGVNVEPLRGLLEACRGQPLKRFVHFSSLGVYAARHHYGTDESEPLPRHHIDGYTMFATALSDPAGSAGVNPEVVDRIPLAAGVDRKWFLDSPPPLPNRGKVPDDWRRVSAYIEDHNSGSMEFRPPDALKVWNSAFAGDPCKHPFLHHAPGMLYFYDPPDGAPRPPYRFMPNATLPSTAPILAMSSAGSRHKTNSPHTAYRLRIL